MNGGHCAPDRMVLAPGDELDRQHPLGGMNSTGAEMDNLPKDG
jgi:hypothetical protein